MMLRPQVTIGELERRGAIVKIQDGNHGEKHPVAADYVPTGVPFLMASDINDGVVDLIGCKFITKQQADSLRIGFARSGDVLLTHKGTVGSVAVLPHIEDYAMLTPQVTYYRVDGQQLSNRYLRYAFAAPDFQARLKGVSAQSTRPYIGITAQRSLEITWVERTVQERIASILSVYDDLIENNTRRINILEDMAQMLYREWFVNFHFPGHEDVEMVESELGLIPEGWRIGTMGDLLALKSGFAFKSSTFDNAGQFGLVTIRNVHDGSFSTDCQSRISEPPANLPKFCILQAGDVLMSLTGNIGRTCLVYGRNLLLNQRVAKVMPNRNVDLPFVYFLLRQTETQKRLEQISTGVAQQNLSPVKATEEKLVVPSLRLRDRLSGVVGPMVAEIVNLFTKNDNLRTTRDLLLPKLISGEVMVDAAAEQAAELVEQTA